jgi:Mn2+/Fe2+ NRAMP family transporter
LTTKSGSFWERHKEFGPAWLTMMADIDAASVIVASQTGALYHYGFIWLLAVLIVPLFFIQEVAGRIGVATGKGLGELVRVNLSHRASVIATAPMALVDILSYVAEYAGIAIGMQVLGIPPYVSLPIAYAVHLGLVAERKYSDYERILLAVSAVFIVSYVISMFRTGIAGYTPFLFETQPSYFVAMAAIVGAVVMPFMLFFQTSATAEKGAKDARGMRIETLLGAMASEGIMIAIVISCAGINSSTNFYSANGLANGLSAFAGPASPYLFAVGLIATAFLALVVISLGSTWGITEALGWGRKSNFWIIVAETAPAILVPLFFSNLENLIIDLMVLNVFALLVPGILMGILAAREKLMGEHTLKGMWKIAFWTSLFVVVATGFLAVLL